MPDSITADQTRTSAATDVPTQISRTRTIDDLVQDAGYLRNVNQILSDDVAETGRRAGRIHHRAFEVQLNNNARQMARRSPGEMLNELADTGFAWRDIARLLGVSVPAVRRWRQGESPTGEHLLAIARLVAFVEILRADHLASSVASWMEMPLTPEVPVTGIDLGADGRFEDLLDLAAGHATPEDVLNRWQPNWRERYRSEFEVFEATDGELGIRRAVRDDG